MNLGLVSGCVVFSAIHSQAQAQTRTVTGTVNNGEKPISGVVVTQEGSSQMTITTATGAFSLQITGENPILIFRHPEYGERKITTDGKSTFTIALTEKVKSIEEVVLNAGYYNVKAKESTGSISKVTAKDIENQPVNNVLSAVQGRMAGVSVVENSGIAGGSFDVQIRGKNSLRADGNYPLIIVDGIPINTISNSFSVISSGVLPKGNANPLNSISPNNIESFEVLKDADATAIYGSRGANGVILITTKHGGKRKSLLQISLSTSISKANRFLQLSDTEEYLQMRRNAYKFDGITAYPNTAYDINGKWDSSRESDWYKKFIGREFIGQQQQISWSGGTDNAQWYLGINNLNQQSPFGNEFGYTRKGVDFNSTFFTANKKLKITPTLQYSIQKNNLADSDLTNHIFLSPNSPDLYTTTGDLNWEYNTFDNPYGRLENKYKTNINMLSMGINAEYNIEKNLVFKLNTGYTNTQQKEMRLNPSSAFNPNLGYTSTISQNYSGRIIRESWIVEPQLHWNKTYGKHKISTLIGSTWENREDALFRVLASDFPSNSLIENTSSAKVQKILEDTGIQYRYMAFFSRLNYSYNQRYILNFTARRDGSSRFGPDKRFSSFGAIGAAWLFSNENALKNSLWLSYGKLRTSVGTTGSDLIGDYQFMDTYTTANGNYNGTIGMYPSRLFNPEFSWEKTLKQEAALELGFLKDRINLTLVYYRNRSSNQLTGIPLPATTGFLTVQSNFPAKVENTGIEAELNAMFFKKHDVDWSFFGNISVPKSKLLQFDNIESSSYANIYRVGESMNIKKVYELKGVNPQTGIYEFTDFNGDGKIDANDRTKVVDYGVKFYGGIGNNISFKNISAGFLFQFVNQRQYNLDYNLPILGIMRNVPTYMLDYWTPENTTATYMKPTTGADSAVMKAYSQYQSSDAMIVDASYVRLSNLNIGYKIPLNYKLIQEFFLQLQAKNIWTMTKYKGLDPEVQGLYMPSVRIYSLIATLKF
ncbi:SusC/RagA family TonB-linked outer membrane protein [Kaistella sp.]|uniref:SusC/RagA family TonB-linked outer membrane protein n=1 Tax=Kaistella sp. TaxID=2782235 RepID=UPI003C6F87DB